MVRAWSANFCYAGGVIEELAIWVIISGLPIKYYDNRVLSYIGYHIGKTVKVDKNTISREIGKYARLFGHSTSGCSDKKAPQTEVKGNTNIEEKPQGNNVREKVDTTTGPWMVV
ncbi:hypothetical protein KIW84_021886 [Lathyrus oleraceus]|uniref:DUF4283 domain-containing protein n=1 Tax=Pisum sativum TaxID=3888 RepID=A0A9D4Y913_PEA|nr:hypothetical protein KIW84_021886 [Pisum sativum]